jgi:protein required for attachment to host cells
MAAEPGFLGLLREALDPETARMLVGSLPKDLQHMRPEEVAPHVLPLLA